MSTQPQTIQDMVLLDRDTHDKSCGVTITRDLGNCDCNKEELQAALSAMMAEEFARGIEAGLEQARDMILYHFAYSGRKTLKHADVDKLLGPTKGVDMSEGRG